MENGNNNYSFTPVREDNSVNEIKNDFFGGSSAENNNEVSTEVPPVLDVPEVKEEIAPVENQMEQSVEPVLAETNTNENPLPTLEESSPEPLKEEIPINGQANESSLLEKSIKEVNTPVENVVSEPVEVKIPEGLDEEIKEGTPEVVETPSVPENTPEQKSENNKKGRSIFDFFKTKDAPTIGNTEVSPSNAKTSELDPFNNFVASAPEVSVSESVSEPAVDDNKDVSNNEINEEIPLPSLEEEEPVVGEADKEIEEKVSEPVIEPALENYENTTFNDVKPTYSEPEPVKEPEPIVKEVVVEKEKVVLGNKCPNCGEITAEPFCPNCGFLVE